MEYVVPEIEVMGSGSELVQAFVGPHNDFGAFSLSLGFTSTNVEQE